MKKQPFFLLLAFLFFILLTACGGKESEASRPSGLSAAFKVAYIEQAKFYSARVKDETGLSASYRLWQEDLSKMVSGAGDQAYIMNQCYINFNEAVIPAAAAVFGSDASQNPLADAEQNDAFLNALVSSNFYAGNIELCQQAGMDIMQYLRTQRDSNFGLRSNVIDQFRSYDLSMRESQEIAAFLHFYNQYGPELADLFVNGEGYLLDQLAAENGLDPLPVDFIGFPTAALEVSVSDVNLCFEYNKIYTGEMPAPLGRHPSLYLTEYDPVINSCKLYRQAAYSYMDRLFVNKQVGRQLDCGIDAGAFGQLDESCNLVPQQ